MADTDVYASGLYLVPKAQRVVLKKAEDGSHVVDIFEQCKKLQIDLLVPTMDIELLSICPLLHEFESIECKVLIAKKETLLLCEDKLSLLSKVARFFPNHKFFSYDQNIDVHQLTLPVVLKPRLASDSRLAQMIHSKVQLETYKRDGSYFLQDYLPGQEYSVDVYRNADGEVIACVPRARLKIQNDIVITGETRNSPVLIELTKNIAHEINLFGVANIQFKEDKNGSPVLMEVNARFPATMSLTVQSGANVPKIFVEEVLEQKQMHELIPVKEIAMTRCYQEIYFEPSEIIR
ncbi:MAG: ATP-grasp domain-containing protein [Bdellovibrionota bacterium]